MSSPDLIVRPEGPGAARGMAEIDGARFPCALGRSGVTTDKSEGDGATPAGSFPLRLLLYRPDRMAAPMTSLKVRLVRPVDGWCDDPAAATYNKWVLVPNAYSHERLWRDDHLYDIVIVVGYNDEPIVPGKGSAIFIHAAREDMGPTEGCVAFAWDDLLQVVRRLGKDSRLVVHPA